MKKIISLLVAVLLGFSTYAQNTNNLLDDYLNIKNALVSSDGKSASEHINSFYNKVNQEDNFPQKKQLMKVTEKLLMAEDNIDKQRAAFNDVSIYMWELVKGSDKVNEVVYYQYCPMKKSYWLSKDQAIRNPFYGSAMLTCGEITETKD